MVVDPKVEVKEKVEGSLLDIYSPGFEPSEIPPTHLIFLIHGIGYKMFDKNKFNENINTLSETATTILNQKYGDSGMKLFYVPIEWAEEFHALTTVDGRINKITLPTVPAMRVITNDCLSDVLYYFTDFHRQHLLDIICEKMNKIYKEFKTAYPKFEGHIGVVSHSLGGVISYDLLSVKNQEVGSNDQIYSVAFPRTNYPKLDFEPSFLFTLGSPIGAVMVMRGLKYEDFCLSDDIEFMNIFNPYDPLAYRLEPLISSDYDGLEALPIDIYESGESSYYFPKIASLLPEAPSFIKSAKNLLPAFNNNNDGLEQEGDSDSLGYESCDEQSLDSIDLSKESITIVESKDEDDISTRSLSGFSVSAVGISGPKRGSVIERLHDIKYNNRSTCNSESNSAQNSRPSSFYQGAIDSLFSYSKFNSNSKPKSQPNRPKIGRFHSHQSLIHKQAQFSSQDKVSNLAEHQLIDNSETSSSNMNGSNNLNGFTKESEMSSSYEDSESKHLLAVGPSTLRKRRDSLPTSLSRSKTWAYLDSFKDMYNEEQIMWLWGSMAFNIQQNKLENPKNKKQSHSKGPNVKPEYILINERSEKDTKSTKVDKRVSFQTGDSKIHSNGSQPKLIRKLTPKCKKSSVSESDISQYFQNKKDDLGVVDKSEYPTKINLPDENCHTTTMELIRTPGHSLTEDTLIQEKEALRHLSPDAQYPPSCCSPQNDTDIKEKQSGNLKRYDYCIQTKAISNLSMEYFVGLGAHFSYWDNKDVAYKMLQVMSKLKKKDKAAAPPINV